MEGTEGSLLDAIYEDDETLENDGDDVEMVDADDGSAGDGGVEAPEGRRDAGGEESLEVGRGPRRTNPNPNPSAGKRKKKKKKRRRSGSAPNITDINRFVIDTCKRLKEKKSYLVWNAIGCLGVSAFSDLVKEVDAIQRCGGQKTADESRFRTGGGILWNILKTREPKAYKEIMAKGREFENQLLQPKKRQKTNTNEEAVSPNANAPEQATEEEVLDSSERISEVQSAPEPPDSIKGRVSVLDRVRVPVSYDDLFEEGEIHE